MKKHSIAEHDEETQSETQQGTGEKPIEILKEDHQKVKGLFEEFEDAEENEEKERIVKTAITELKIHAAIEEEIFYPAAREEMDDNEEDEDLMNEANEEHHVVKLLIGELESMGAEDENYDAKFTVLAENVKHHIKEEETEMFPKIKNSEANSEELGQAMVQRKEQLKSEYGVFETEENDEEDSMRNNPKKQRNTSGNKRSTADNAGNFSGTRAKKGRTRGNR